MKLRLAALALFVLCAGVRAAPFPSISQDVGVCDPNAPQNCLAPNSSGQMPVTGTFTATLGGFTPSSSGARMTPITVTTSDSSGTLPTGAVAVVSNVGANPMYCNVNGVVATTSDELIPTNSWFAFTIPSGGTTLHCIATGGSTTANGVGGSGLPTGAGGGSSGGGGGGAVFGPTAVGSAAANPPVLVGGTSDGTGTGTVGVQKVVSGISYLNVAQVNGVTTLAGAGAVGTGSQRVAVGQDTTTIAGSAPGTAGTASSNVMTIQGIASMTPVQSAFNATPSLANGSGVVPTQGGSVLSATNGLYANLLLGNAASATGAGATGATTQRVGVAQDTTTIAGSAPGTAGTPSANVVTVQGPTSGGTALPVSGTVTANAGTNLNTSALSTSANQTNKSQFTQLTDGTNPATGYTAYGTPPTGNVPAFNAYVTNTNANGPAAPASASPVTPSNQPVGGANFANTQVSVASTATQIVAARTGVAGTGRVSATVCNTSTVAVYLGGSGVTTSTGQYLAGVAGACATFNTTAAIYGIVATGTETVGATEVY